MIKEYTAPNSADPSAPSAPVAGGAAWHVLTLAQSIAKIKRQFADLSLQRAYEGRGPIDYFLPTCYMRVNRFGTQVMVTRKMLFTYIFIRDTEAGIRELKRSIPELRLLTEPVGGGRRRPMVVSDREMDMFRTIAAAYAGQLPCYRVGDIDLEEGDRVQVVGGQFDGVVGTLRTTPGRGGGQVVLALAGLFLVSTGDIAPQYIRILEFGRGNRHPYRQFDAHLPRAAAALAQRQRGDDMPAAALAHLQVFTARFALLQPPTVNVASTHAGLMLMSYAALDDRPQRDRWLAECEALLPRVTAEQQRGLHLAMMHAATRRPDLAAQLRQLVAAWQPIAPTQQKKQTIARLLAQFQQLTPADKRVVSHRSLR